jgi:GntR family transcriptional regulator
MSIQDEIENGRWEPGSAIPTERTIAEQHNVSIGTVKRALLELVNEGYLYRVQGKGTFVAGTIFRRHNLRYYLLLDHFDDEEAELKINLLSRRLETNCPSVCKLLELKNNQKLCLVKRVFTWKEFPLIFTVSYFPIQIFKDMMDLPSSFFENYTLWDAIEQIYGLPTISNKELFGVHFTHQEEAEILCVSPGTPVQYIEMLSFTYKKRPYEFRKTYCLTNERKIFRKT